MLLYKDLAAPEMSRLAFFQQATWGMAAVGTLLLIASCRYFLGHPASGGGASHAEEN